MLDRPRNIEFVAQIEVTVDNRQTLPVLLVHLLQQGCIAQNIVCVGGKGGQVTFATRPSEACNKFLFTPSLTRILFGHPGPN